MIRGTQSLSASTAATLDFTAKGGVRAISLSNSGGQAVYGLLAFATGDTEVSSTNFNFIVPAGGTFQLQDFLPQRAPVIQELRLISGATAYVGYVAW